MYKSGSSSGKYTSHGIMRGMQRSCTNYDHYFENQGFPKCMVEKKSPGGVTLSRGEICLYIFVQSTTEKDDLKYCANPPPPPNIHIQCIEEEGRTGVGDLHFNRRGRGTKTG